VPNGLEDILRCKDRQVDLRLLLFGNVAVELVIELQTTDLGQIVSLGVKE
jgi:hypothetical protein